MKSTQKKVNGVTGHWSEVIDSKTRNRWFPSLTLGLLTTVLGMVGIVRVANADELPEQPNSELDKALTEQSQTNNVSPQDENLLGQQQEPANRESPIPNPSSATTELGAAEATTDKSISLDQPADLTAHRQETEVSVSNTNLVDRKPMLL
jgi:cytoskeletal protein RodZ